MKKQLIFIVFVFSFLPKGLFAQCTEDCVWPGDANANGIANHLDFLAIGYSFGETGPTRANQSVAWEPLEADNWAETLPFTGANFKHSDTNGNGEISWLDVEAITNNFHMTNPNFLGLWGNNLVGDDLQAVASEDIVTPGTTFEIDLQLGDENNQIENIYGIGFTLSLNSEYIESVEINIDDSWLLASSPGLTGGSFLKYPPNENELFIAISRFDGQPISGFGSIGKLEIVIVDVIDALIIDPTDSVTLELQLKDVLAINDLEEDMLITINQDSVIIKHPSQITSSTEKPISPAFNVFPNPVKKNLTIQFERFSPHFLKLTNAQGQVVIQEKLSLNVMQNSIIKLPLDHLLAGVYYLECVSNEQTLVRKVVVH